MTTQERIKMLFNKYNINFSAPVEEVIVAKLAEVVLEDDTVIYSEDEVIVTGSQVTIINSDEEKVSVPSGDYTDKDGRILVISDGIVMEIKEVEPEVKVEPEVEVEVEQEIVPVDELSNSVAEVLEMTVKALRAEFEAFKTEFSTVVKAKDTEIEEIKAEFEATGLPRIKKEVVEEKVQLSQKEISTLSPKDRVAYINELYTKNK